MNNLDIARARFLCRRGMLELDIILNSYLTYKNKYYEKFFLDNFICLLNEQDNTLYEWLILKKNLPSGNLFDLIIEINDFYFKKHF